MTTAGLLAVTTGGVAALDTTELENCSDEQTFCTTLTVERPTTVDPEPEGTGTLNYCGPFYPQDDGTFTVDICDYQGNFIQTVTVQPSRPRPRPTQSTILSSAMGALNPPAPTIHTSPSYRAGLLVQTPAWLWLPPSYWRTYSTTISTCMVWGYVVTIFATPTMVRWNMGNGDSVTCIGPGTPWIPGFSDALSTCNYTYRHSSDGASGDRFRITATVTFVGAAEIGSFTTVGLGGMRGPLGAVTRSSSVYAPVAEIQGLVV